MKYRNERYNDMSANRSPKSVSGLAYKRKAKIMSKITYVFSPEGSDNTEL